MIAVDPAAREPLHRQIYSAVRDLIVVGRLRPNDRVPSTRALAADLGVSRNTVLLAMTQLTSEGYLRGRPGAGTRVAPQLPDALLRVDARREPLGTRPTAGSRPVIARRGARTALLSDGMPRLGLAPRPFRHGTPALDRFPVDLWARLAARRYQRVPLEFLDHGEAFGHRPLREAVAVYVGAARGVRCEPGQVLITSGAQQALALAVQVLLDPGDTAWMEDPGYLGMRGVLTIAGARIAPVPVDAEGLDVAAGMRIAPDARLVYTTPSHQFPLGATMSHVRRRALLQWARGANAWIVEDDYESEYRFAGHPLPALHGLDPDGRVLYVGTFSKTVFPSLRIGYLIVPHDLTDAFARARAFAAGSASPLEQAVLADFIIEGHFARHVRRMRTLYAARQAALVALAERELRGRITLRPAAAGLHLLGWLPPGRSDAAVSSALAARGVEAPPLSMYHVGPRAADGALLLGYASLDDVALRQGVDVLREVLGA
ncbi:GntR family transcriptional regulator [Gemmatimonadetes bacterium T265]|nr:GntR family transcriptional regulator [Gemmatimonadetes bacterium T265]